MMFEASFNYGTLKLTHLLMDSLYRNGEYHASARISELYFKHLQIGNQFENYNAFKEQIYKDVKT